jgi:hypothetical protein
MIKQTCPKSSLIDLKELAHKIILNIEKWEKTENEQNMIFDIKNFEGQLNLIIEEIGLLYKDYYTINLVLLSVYMTKIANLNLSIHEKFNCAKDLIIYAKKEISEVRDEIENKLQEIVGEEIKFNYT